MDEIRINSTNYTKLHSHCGRLPCHVLPNLSAAGNVRCKNFSDCDNLVPRVSLLCLHCTTMEAEKRDPGNEVVIAMDNFLRIGPN